MMKKALFLLINCCVTAMLFSQSEMTKYTIIENKADRKVDILANGKIFTSYIYPTSLKKPVLYPIRTSAGTPITRGWPLAPRPNERADHPHHVGLWFNYGNVNGYDFWNNSDSIAEDKKQGYGTIVHRRIDKITQGGDHAALDVSMDWQDPNSKNLLRQNTRYDFSGTGNKRVINLTIKLTALGQDVFFKDSKEGLLGMRMARELELPSLIPERYTDANGNVTDVPILNNEGVSGNYISSTGKQGDSVWATRAEWVKLTGKIKEEKISVTIFDDPGNVGYPTYWHARGYGLFAANPLGQSALSNGKEALNFTLRSGKSVTFRYKIAILSE